MREPQPNFDAEALLRSSGPVPDESFVAELEQRLFPSPPVHPRRLRGALVVGTVAAACLTTAFVGFGLVGEGPVATRGDSDARASSYDCGAAPAVRLPEPVLVKGRGERLDIRYRDQGPRNEVRQPRAQPCP